MPISESAAKPLAAALLACLAREMENLARPPKNISLRPGAQATINLSTRRDECCEGLAWVRVTGIVPSSTVNWPAADVVPTNCGPQMLAVQLEMGIVRCAPTPPAEQLVTDEQWNALSELILDDYAAMYRAFCCLMDRYDTRKFLLGSWTPLGPDGNCIGGILPLTVSAPPCYCGPLESPS